MDGSASVERIAGSSEMTDLVERLRRVEDSLAHEAAAEIERLRAEIAALRADAARYRWLRAEHERVDPCIRASAKYKLDRNSSDWVNIAELDAAIDAARKGWK